jgi:transketolase
MQARRRLLKMHFESGVGHIGGNLSSLDAIMVLLHEFVMEKDTFVLSKGHSAGALYTTLWSLGRLSDADLRTFHKDGTVLSGHTPVAALPGVPFATGSLGHGLSLAAGTALGFRFKQSSGTVFCLTSDGEWQEGSTWEAMIFASHHRLSNLKVFIDHNELQGFGKTATVASMSPLWDKIKGFNAHLQIVDGHNLDDIRRATNVETDSVSIIVLKTRKGHGISFMEDRMEWHYLPLSKQQYDEASAQLSIR